jgi:hypothetical protein
MVAVRLRPGHIAARQIEQALQSKVSPQETLHLDNCAILIIMGDRGQPFARNKQQGKRRKAEFVA